MHWILLAVLSLALAGCADFTPAQAPLPVTGSVPAGLVIHEYALIEQSADNPDHAGFADRARQVIKVERSGFGAPSVADHLAKENEALAPFGYRVDLNPSPPFSGYALYQGDQLVYRDIARFSEISLRGDTAEFTLPFETISGDWLVASTRGLQKISSPPSSNRNVMVRHTSAPLAYAAISGSESMVFAGTAITSLQTGSMPEVGRTVFGEQYLRGQLLYFFEDEKSGTHVHLNYAGSDLPYAYDGVVHNQSGETTVFNPGSDGHIVWFYALRDGLWYYVEAGTRGE